MVERYGPTEREYTTLFAQGLAARRILDEAGNASYIVMASHGRAGFQATFIGSVTDNVVRGSPIPVLVVPGVSSVENPVFTPVVVPLDGSADAENSISLARRLTAGTGDNLVLLRAYRLPHLRGADFASYPPEIKEIADTAKAYLDGIAQENDERILLQSEPSATICEVLSRFDAKLVVMAASGKGLAGRLAPGSTTDRVLHSLHRPLLVVPHQN